MLTCKEASYLASKKLGKKLTLKEQLDFSLHAMMCGLCRAYARDIKVLHHFMIKAAKTGRTLLPDSARLSDKSRTRIKKSLDKAEHLKDEES